MSSSCAATWWGLRRPATSSKILEPFFFRKLERWKAPNQNQSEGFSNLLPSGLEQSSSAPKMSLHPKYRTLLATFQSTVTARCVGTSRVILRPYTDFQRNEYYALETSAQEPNWPELTNFQSFFLTK